MQPAYAKADMGRWIEDTGFVRRLLHDGDDDSCHQRFIIQLSTEQTLLIAHNIDVAERIPLSLGDRVHFRGVYEWNDLGGRKTGVGCATGARRTPRFVAGAARDHPQTLWSQKSRPEGRLVVIGSAGSQTAIADLSFLIALASTWRTRSAEMPYSSASS